MASFAATIRGVRLDRGFASLRKECCGGQRREEVGSLREPESWIIDDLLTSIGCGGSRRRSLKMIDVDTEPFCEELACSPFVCVGFLMHVDPR